MHSQEPFKIINLSLSILSIHWVRLDQLTGNQLSRNLDFANLANAFEASDQRQSGPHLVSVAAGVFAVDDEPLDVWEGERPAVDDVVLLVGPASPRLPQLLRDLLLHARVLGQYHGHDLPGGVDYTAGAGIETPRTGEAQQYNEREYA